MSCYVSLLFLIGHKYLHDCSYYPFIPVNLIINGVVVIALVVVGPPFLWLASKDNEKWYTVVMGFVFGISILAFVGCFVLGKFKLEITSVVSVCCCRPRLLKNLGELKIALLKMPRRGIGEQKIALLKWPRRAIDIIAEPSPCNTTVT